MTAHHRSAPVLLSAAVVILALVGCSPASEDAAPGAGASSTPSGAPSSAPSPTPSATEPAPAPTSAHWEEFLELPLPAAGGESSGTTESGIAVTAGDLVIDESTWAKQVWSFGGRVYVPVTVTNTGTIAHDLTVTMRVNQTVGGSLSTWQQVRLAPGAEWELALGNGAYVTEWDDPVLDGEAIQVRASFGPRAGADRVQVDAFTVTEDGNGIELTYSEKNLSDELLAADRDTRKVSLQMNDAAGDVLWTVERKLPALTAKGQSLTATIEFPTKPTDWVEYDVAPIEPGPSFEDVAEVLVLSYDGDY